MSMIIIKICVCIFFTHKMTHWAFSCAHQEINIDMAKRRNEGKGVKRAECELHGTCFHNFAHKWEIGYRKGYDKTAFLFLWKNYKLRRNFP